MPSLTAVRRPQASHQGVARDGRVVFRDLVKDYGTTRALNGVNLEVESGEFISVLGPSGCGKTTCLRILGGFMRPTSGSVQIGGLDVTDLPPNKRPVNTVFQSYALFPHMTVAENIAYGPKRAGLPKAERMLRVDECLEMVGLAGLGDRHPTELSGGQAQRVALARCIVNQPPVLLLDEPLAALDLKLRKRMQRELRQLHQELGITFIYVTHDQDEALTMSDRIVLLNHGEIEQVGAGRTLYDTPRSRFVADFLGSANIFDATVVHASEELVLLGAFGTQLTASVRQWQELPTPGQTISVMVRPERIQVTDIERVRADLPREAVEAVVLDHIFRGDHILLTCEVAPGVTWDVRHPLTIEPPPSVGSRCRLEWSTEDAVTLEAG